MKELDLYSEAKPRYYQLIPNREDGLILLALYQKYHSCALEIGELYNELRLSKSHETEEEKRVRIREISNEYDLVLRKYENHEPIDREKLMLNKYHYHGLNWFERFMGHMKYYFFVKLKYHILIWGPLILFLALNFTRIYAII
ncbi:SLATT domain-containing protein [Sphingobacterium sp. UBA6320]|uniref:SLATT domain-containing protein n=1 Tax=Sphingobacterium sp. UBA6320 TaxID=1947510 RepID=UPI0025F1121A|nr:SLATT domain-containing protein [Sphingobacterium sp. UBA6320]